MIDWLVEKGVGWFFQKVVAAPGKGLIKLGFLFRKGIEFQKANVPEARNTTRTYLLLPILVWLLIAVLSVVLGGGMVGAVFLIPVTTLMIYGYFNTTVDPELKKLQAMQLERGEGMSGASQFRFLVPVLLILGVVFVGVGIYLYLRPDGQPIVTTSASSDVVSPRKILIPIMSYSSAKWDSYGPGFDGTDRNHVVQLWMSKSGYISYSLTLEDPPTDHAIIAVRLSSELKQTTSTDNRYSSGIALLVNGQSAGIKNVIPDNNIGEAYEWTVPAAVLRSGSNEIRLQTSGQHITGLCIYSPLEVALHGESIKGQIVFSGQDLSLASIRRGETLTLTYLSGKVITNTKTNYSSPIWGVPAEKTNRGWLAGLPIKNMWSDAIYLEAGNERVPFHEGQSVITISNRSSQVLQVQLKVNDSRFWDDGRQHNPKTTANVGDARFEYKVGR